MKLHTTQEKHDAGPRVWRIEVACEERTLVKVALGAAIDSARKAQDIVTLGQLSFIEGASGLIPVDEITQYERKIERYRQAQNLLTMYDNGLVETPTTFEGPNAHMIHEGIVFGAGSLVMWHGSATAEALIRNLEYAPLVPQD